MAGCFMNEVDMKVGASASSVPLYPVAGEIISRNLLDSGEVISSIRREWKESIYGKVDITHLEGNRYLFSITHVTLAEKVIEDGPWTILGHFLCLSHWDSDEKLDTIYFYYIPIWVQVHGLMSSYICNKNAETLGKRIGKVLEVDEKSLNPFSKRGFFRVKVLLDCYKVIKTGGWVNLADDGGRNNHVDFKYETMADLCYKCGRFGHYIDECQEEGVPHPLFGPWLKATEATSFDAEFDLQDPKDDDKLLAPMAAGKRGRDMDKRLKFKDDGMLMGALVGLAILLLIVAVLVKLSW